MIIEPIVLIIVGLLIIFMFNFLKKVIFLVLNSIVGLLALFGFNTLFHSNIVISVWSILIAGIGGSIGFVIILVLHFLHIAF